MKFDLFLKIALALIGCMLLPLPIHWWTYYSTRLLLEDRELESLRTEAEESVEKWHDVTERLRLDVQRLASHNSMQQLIRQQGELSEAKPLQELLHGPMSVEMQPIRYKQAVLIDRQGQVKKRWESDSQTAVDVAAEDWEWPRGEEVKKTQFSHIISLGSGAQRRLSLWAVSPVEMGENEHGQKTPPDLVGLQLDLTPWLETTVLDPRRLTFLTTSKGKCWVQPAQPVGEDLVDIVEVWPELEVMFSEGMTREGQWGFSNQAEVQGAMYSQQDCLCLQEETPRWAISCQLNHAAWQNYLQSQHVEIRTDYRQLFNEQLVVALEKMSKQHALQFSRHLEQVNPRLVVLGQGGESKANVIKLMEDIFYLKPNVVELQSYAVYFRWLPVDGQPKLGLVVAGSPEEMLADMNEQATLLLMAYALLCMPAMVAAFGLARLIVRPLRQLTLAAHQIAKRRFDVVLPERRSDEIGELARAFRSMVSDLQQKDEELNEESARTRAIVSMAAEGIITFDEDTRCIESINRAAEQIFGYGRHEMQGQSFARLLAENETVEEVLESCSTIRLTRVGTEELVASRELTPTTSSIWTTANLSLGDLRYEVTGRRKNGQNFPMELSISKTEIDRREGYTVIVRDISKQKQDEEKIRQLNESLERRVQERTAQLESAKTDLEQACERAETLSRAKDVFVANVSHELRNPLNLIFGGLQFLEASELNEDQQKDIKVSMDAALTLRRLINDILDYQRVVLGGLTLDPVLFDVGKFVGDVAREMQFFAKENENELLIEQRQNLGQIFADHNRLRQILVNLLSNSCKFTKKGRVTLYVSRIQRESLDCVEFMVVDTGRGMSAAELGKIFNKFNALPDKDGNKSGTGLGLVITKSLVELMQGRITVRSQLGQGTTFIVTIPYQPTPEPAKNNIELHELASARTPPTPRVGDNLVLVIDDDQRARELLDRYLTGCGYQVATAADGETGLKLAHELRPAAITLDVLMPGLDGWTVLGRIKSDPLLAATPVIMVSILDKEKSFALGADDYVVKPIQYQRLSEVLQRFLPQPLNRQILIVDDDSATRANLKRLLTQSGWEVAEAEHGAQALELLRQEHPAAILLDLMMPVMDGFEFLVHFRQHAAWQHIPLLVLTAKDPTPREREFLHGSPLLQKGSYSHEELLQFICRSVETASPTAQAE